MKVLLTTLNAKYIHSSLALAYFKEYLKKDFPGIHLKEYTINELSSQIMADIYSYKPDIICFSCYIWNIEQITKLCSDLKKVQPDVKIAVGGPEVSYDAGTFLRENIAVDYVIRGEGERTLKELLYCLKQQITPEKVSGLTYRDQQRIIENLDRPLIEDLDEIPFPYDEDNIHDYQNRVIYFETSRGCPFNCSYCLSSTIKGVRCFSLERVFADLEFLMIRDVPEIKFVDRTFNCNEKRSIEIMDYIIHNNRKTKFHFEIDASLLSDHMLSFLSQVPAGIFDFEIGIQSTHPKTLKSINRHAQWEKEKENIKDLLANNNIHIHLDLIAGLPYEDYQRFKTSFNDVYNINPHVIQLGFLKLLKGSGIRSESEAHGYTYEELPPYQVLGNHYLDYHDLLKLNRIEDLVNRYYNTGIVKNSLDYITRQIYQGDAFAFYEEFAGFLEEKDFFRVGHKREEEYLLIYEFVARRKDNKSSAGELIKLDYLLNNQSGNVPAFFTDYNPPNRNEELYAVIKNEDFIKLNLPGLSSKPPRERRRLVHLEYLLLKDDLALAEKPVPFLFVYDSTSKKAVSFLANIFL